jgi:beta-N-acetylglucosaminidase
MRVATKFALISGASLIGLSLIGARIGITNGLTLEQRATDIQPASLIYQSLQHNTTLSYYTTDFEEIQEPVTDIETILNRHLKGKLAGRGDSFARYGREYRVDPALLVAIAIHETGNGTSKAINELNNAGGIMLPPNFNQLRQFISVNASIEHMAWLIRNTYMDSWNLYSIEEIGNRYCPEGASNDPTNLNQYWIPNVTRIYEEITGEEYKGGY